MEQYHLSSIMNSSDRICTEGKVSVLFITCSQVHWLPFLVKPDPCKLHFSGSFPSRLPVNLCQREALAGYYGEEGSKSQIIPPLYPSPPPSPSLPSVASNQTCASSSHQVPSSWGLGTFPFFSLQLCGWGGSACCCCTSLCWLTSPFGFAALLIPHD